MASADKCDHKPACIYEMMERLGIEVGGGIRVTASLMPPRVIAANNTGPPMPVANGSRQLPRR